MVFKRHDYSNTIAQLNKIAETGGLEEAEDYCIEKEAENIEPPDENAINLMFADYYRESTNERIVKSQFAAKKEAAQRNCETATDSKGNAVGFRRTS